MNLLFIGEGAIDSLLISLVALVFDLVAKVFELFYVLSNVSTVDSSIYESLVRNFYMVLTVIMLFAIAFGLLKAMINPDDSKGAGEAGNIFKKIVTSIIILTILPTIFNFAFGLQNAIISQNTIGKLFGDAATQVANRSSVKEQGYRMANSVFTAFFTPTDKVCEKGMKISECQEKIEAKSDIFGKSTLADAINSVDSTGNFTYYSDFGDNVADGEISFNFIVLLFGGLFFAYVILSFCFDLGIRAVKLVFYQIIAPIPVLLRIVPQEKLSGTFNTWVKIVVSCYLEVFIRMFVLYFGVYLASAFTTGKAFGGVFDDATGLTWLLAKAILIMSIIVFIKQCPKLIGDIFGIDSGNMKLGLRDKLAAGGLFAAGTAVGGAGISTLRNLRNFKGQFAGKSGGEKKKTALRMLKGGAAGIVGGAARGFKSGANAKSLSEMKAGITTAVNETTAQQDARDDLFARGGNSIVGGYVAKLKDRSDASREFFLGTQQQANAKISAYDELIGLNDSAKKSAKSLVEKGKKMSYDQLNKKYGQSVADYIQKSKNAELDYDVAQKELDAAINSDRNSPNYERIVSEAREKVMIKKDGMGKINKDAEDYLTELLYSDTNTWNNFNSDLKIDLSNGRVAADKVRVKLTTPEYSSEQAVISAGISPETVANIGYKIGMPDGTGIKAAIDNLEIEKGKLATESAIYNETHKNDSK